MAFFAPQVSDLPMQWLQQELQRRRQQFGESLDLQNLAERHASEMGASARADQARQDERDYTGQQLAMTPGVRAGGSTATIGQSDSSLNVGAGHPFTRYGKDYTFDPTMAGTEKGQEVGAEQTAADQARYDALRRLPGFSDRMAAREVYGRSGIMDMPDPHDTRAALAAYMQHPSRDTAANVLTQGGNASIFPAPNMFNADGTLKAPMTPQQELALHLAERQGESNIAEGREKRVQAQAIAERAAITDPRTAVSVAAKALDELRRDVPRPSKQPDAPALGLPGTGGPLYEQTVSDSLDYELGKLGPARARLKAAQSGIPTPYSGTDPATDTTMSPATKAANARMALQVARQKAKQAAAIQAGTAQPLQPPSPAAAAAPSGPAAPTTAAKGAPDPSAWAQANPPKPGESLAAYKQRAEAALRPAPE